MITRQQLETEELFAKKDRRDKTKPCYNTFYPFTNENLAYLRGFNYQNKKTLTPGSSCDQVFNLMHHGCNDITVFDLNPNVDKMFQLKRACILKLKPEELIAFLHRTSIFSNRLLSDDILVKLLKYMDFDAQEFWSDIFNKYSKKEIYDKLFYHRGITVSNILRNNDYLKGNYRLLRRKFDNLKIEFKRMDISELPELKERFDFMLLSNILDSAYRIDFSENDRGKFAQYRTFLLKLSTLLKDKGRMFFHYVWDCYDFDIYLELLEYLAKDGVYDIELPASSGEKKSRDSVAVYTKK